MTNQRFIRLKGAPREIALGFSLGLMIGMTPFFGIHLIASLVVASFLGWSKIAAIIGANITNVFTAPVIYPVNYWVGVRLVWISRDIRWPTSVDVPGLLALIKQSPLVLVDLFVGGVILGLPLAMAGYIVVFRVANTYRQCRRPSVPDQNPR